MGVYFAYHISIGCVRIQNPFSSSFGFCSYMDKPLLLPLFIEQT